MLSFVRELELSSSKTDKRLSEEVFQEFKYGGPPRICTEALSDNSRACASLAPRYLYVELGALKPHSTPVTAGNCMYKQGRSDSFLLSTGEPNMYQILYRIRVSVSNIPSVSYSDRLIRARLMSTASKSDRKHMWLLTLIDAHTSNQSNSMRLPLSRYPPKNLPTMYPIYAPVTMVTGHFCHSRSLPNRTLAGSLEYRTSLSG